MDSNVRSAQRSAKRLFKGSRCLPNTLEYLFLPKRLRDSGLLRALSHLLELALSLEPDDGLPAAAAAELLEELVEGGVRGGEHREGAALGVQPHVQPNLHRKPV